MLNSYEIVPGRSVGPFQLGDTLWHILDLIRSERIRFPKVELAWDTSKAHASDLTLSLSHLTLYFPHPSQRLSLIKITSIRTSSLTLSYGKQVLHSSTQTLTRGVVGRVLGPTHSGNGGSLYYPGVKFEISSSQAGGGSRDDSINDLTVTAKDEGLDTESNLLSAVSVKPNQGVTIHIPHEIEVVIGQTTSQDLLLDLGPPLRKYVKEDERMERIWGEREKHPNTLRGTFWNYFQYGIDFLISPEGFVQKILLHSNVPGTPLFQRHARCPWSLTTPSGPLQQASPLASFRSYLAGENTDHLQVPTPSSSTGPNTSSSGGKKPKKNRNPSPSATSDTSDSSEVKSSGFVKSSGLDKGISARGDEDGMILDRVVEGGLDGVEGMSPSRLVDFYGLILEEDTGSGGITSVLVFKAD